RAQVQSRSVVPVLVEDLLGKRDRDLGALPGRVSLARVEEAAPQVADLQPRLRRQERRGGARGAGCPGGSQARAPRAGPGGPAGGSGCEPTTPADSTTPHAWPRTLF